MGGVVVSGHAVSDLPLPPSDAMLAAFFRKVGSSESAVRGARFADWYSMGLDAADCEVLAT